MANLQTFRQSPNPLALKNLDLQDKNVLVRVDFNCPVENGVVTNNYRIKESLATLNFLKEKGAKKITLVTHFGRPDGKFSDEFSLKVIKAELEKVWGQAVECPEYKADYQTYSNTVTQSAAPVILWENVRFWPEEEKNDPSFAQALAQGQTIYINEAFSSSHRAHASVTGVAKLLPAYAGFRLGEETRQIFQLMNRTASPSVAIVGGAKIETKVPVLEALGKLYDQILLGGLIAQEYADFAQNNPQTDWMKKVKLPQGHIGEDGKKLDIDENSAHEFGQIIALAKKILWNGPVGKFEDEKYRQGSIIIAEAVSANQQAFRLVGGGDTVELLEKLGLQDQVGFVSTGGGAMLDYIAAGTLPGLEPLTY